MKIDSLIDRNFSIVSVLEDMFEIAELIKEQPYMAVVDEELKTIGIVTVKDVQHNSCHCKIIDCNIRKPHASRDHTIYEVFNLMKSSQTDFLPVYENNDFVGVIGLVTLAEWLFKLIEETKQNYQRVIHDIRNPIYNISGLSGLLQESITDTENLALINLCSISCKNAIDILDDLLFFELEESKPLSKVITEMNSFYQQCINEQTGLSRAKQIQIQFEISKEAVYRTIDRSQLKRAIQNVISNAIKFSYPHSTIKASSKVENEKLILKIVDSGIGIPLHLQPVIFDKFTSAKREGTNAEASTGLGLCFTKECLEHHNGSIAFKSTEGKGTKFYISL